MSNILMTNFNEKVTPPAKNDGVGIGGGNPHKLYNNFSISGNKKSILGKKPKIDGYTKIKDLIEFAENLVGKECIVKEDSVVIRCLR